MEAVQFRLVSLVSEDVALKMVERRGTTDIAILEDKIRLIRGQSTDNIDLHASFESLETTKEKRKVLEDLLAKKGLDIRKILEDNGPVDVETG
jgi:hypothetical protein